jgi:hypothetical protein
MCVYILKYICMCVYILSIYMHFQVFIYMYMYMYIYMYKLEKWCYREFIKFQFILFILHPNICLVSTACQIILGAGYKVLNNINKGHD